MCVLEPFIYDPLVEWSRIPRALATAAAQAAAPGAGQFAQALAAGAGAALAQGESENSEGVRIVHDIGQRLSGINVAHSNDPLTVQNQVQQLISEATDVSLLAQMYVGWAPFL